MKDQKENNKTLEGVDNLAIDFTAK